jgi:predicted extracellular nuclease
MSLQIIKTGIAAIVVAAIILTSGFIKKNEQAEKNEFHYRIMFYNIENLFDIYDDNLTADEEFTPSGMLHWTIKRYNTKLRNTCKVIIAAGGWRPPDIIGFCEIENRQVLQDLIDNTPLLKYPYRIVHENSPDRRGIDAALIYNDQTVKYIFSRSFSVNKKGLFTRDILYVKVILRKDTCHFFVNHWPSRSTGQLETEPDRFAAAGLLKRLTDSLFSINSSAKILIMGDFNDEPTDESLVGELNVQNNAMNPYPGELYNMTKAPESGPVKGTLKYQGEWNIFDQIIVSGSLLSHEEGLSVDSDGYNILREPFLLAIDEKYNGYKPYRTYNGFNYQGGFSDHLPVYIDLVSR